MFGSALYYLYIDIEDGKWLRSAILFWDEIQTIVPTSIKKPYKSKDTRICAEEGYLSPLPCDLHGDVLNQLGKRVINLVQNPEGPSDLDPFASNADPNSYALVHAHKLGHALRHELRAARLHPAKLSAELRALFPGAEHTDANNDWLLVDASFASTYMSALAALLSREIRVSPLTNEEAALGINLRCLIDDVASSSASDAKGAIVTLLMESLRVDPNTKVEKLISFRRSRSTQLSELSALFDDLATKIEKCESGRELESRAKVAFETKIRPGLEKLKNELNNQRIQATWDGVYRAITVSVPAGGALAYFTGLSGTLLLTAGAALAITDVAVKTYLTQRKARSSSPYTYLLDVERRFSAV